MAGSNSVLMVLATRLAQWNGLVCAIACAVASKWAKSKIANTVRTAQLQFRPLAEGGFKFNGFYAPPFGCQRIH